MKTTKVELTEQEAHLFREFMKRYEVIGYLVGYMESFGMFDMRNANISIDIDNDGIIQHTSVSRHYRKQTPLA